MEEITTSGIVIREKMQGESDKLITILTGEHGKITVLAKGVKNITNKNAAACQLFVYSDYEFVTKGTRRILKTALSKDVFFGMRCDAERFALVSYFADVLNHVTMENNDEIETLRLFLNVIYALSYKQDIPLWLIKGAFELRLMGVLGFMPDFSFCTSCGCETEFGNSAVFGFEQGGIVCEKCCESSKKALGYIPYSCNVSAGVISAMNYICSCDIKKLLSLKTDVSISGEFAFICENYLLHKTERTFETLKIYKSIVNSLNLNIKTEKNEEQK